MYENIWGSIVAFTNDIVDNRKALYPDVEIEYVDWEAHANIQELPDTDLIGTTAITITEDSTDMFSGSFTIGVSTYATDHSLFRLRNYVGEIFKRLQSGSKIAFYDHTTLELKGYMYVTDGTIIMPMTRADTRPLQFIQCQFIFDAVTASDG
jgi:hypothetical protein